MIRFAVLDADGYPTGGGVHRSLPEGAVALPDDVRTEDLASYWFDGAEWQVRPMLPQPVATPDGVEVTGLPEGAVLRIWRAGSEDLWQEPGIAGLARVNLPADGTFEVSVDAPLPWLSVATVIQRGVGSPELVAAGLARAKLVGIARINDAIGKTRLKYVTDIPGQQTIYTAKEAEAKAYLLTNGDPDALSDLVLLAAEVGVTAPTAWELAQVWMNKAVLWKYVAAITEKLRMQTSNAITAATTEDGVDAAVTAALTTLFEGPL